MKNAESWRGTRRDSQLAIVSQKIIAKYEFKYRCEKNCSCSSIINLARNASCTSHLARYIFSFFLLVGGAGFIQSFFIFLELSEEGGVRFHFFPYMMGEWWTILRGDRRLQSELSFSRSVCPKLVCCRFTLSVIYVHMITSPTTLTAWSIDGAYT